ncbi:MAG: hypothetical protein JWM95_2346 [Gemmatimonadetes bacterium]|nr:hypothetical protein [Gemmatimonadota bacterium]
MTFAIGRFCPQWDCGPLDAMSGRNCRIGLMNAPTFLTRAGSLLRRADRGQRAFIQKHRVSIRLQNGQCEFSDSLCEFIDGRARKVESHSGFSRNASEFCEGGFRLCEDHIRLSYRRCASCEDPIRFYEDGARADTLAQGSTTLAASCAIADIFLQTTASRSQIARSGMAIVTSHSMMVTPRSATVGPT